MRSKLKDYTRTDVRKFQFFVCIIIDYQCKCQCLLRKVFFRYRVEIIPTSVGDNKDVSSSVSADRRRMFAKSKSVKNCCSMPVPVGYIFYLDIVH